MPARNSQQRKAGRYKNVAQGAGVATGGERVAGRQAVGAEGQRGLSQNAQAGLGAQLSGRVSSGTIDQGQAQRVAGERGLLQQAYGQDWRQKLYGDRGYVKRLRQALADNPNDTQARSVYEQLMADRKKMVEQAKEKLGQA